MVCPVCNTQAVIKSSAMIFVEEEHKLYRNMVYACRNKKCENFDKEIGTEKKPMDIPVV